MKVAVPVLGSGPDLVVDERFGRARYFWVYDTNTGKEELVENPGFSAPSGAGPAAVQTLKDAGVEVLLACNVGPKARDMLVSAGIEYREVSPDKRAREVLEEFLAT